MKRHVSLPDLPKQHGLSERIGYEKKVQLNAHKTVRRNFWATASR